MGYWGKGRRWTLSDQDKRDFAERKREEFYDRIEKEQSIYINLTGLKTFLTDKNIKDNFKPDRQVTLKHCLHPMKQYKIEKVLKILQDKNIPIRLSDKFYDTDYLPTNTHNELKTTIEYLALQQELKKKPKAKKGVFKI